jgi:cell division septation protein DedD
MSSSQDTEITLGTGKMLVLFFGLVALCAVFFAMGYKLGRTSMVTAAVTLPSAAPAMSQPPPSKPTANGSTASPDRAYYQETHDDTPSPQPAAKADSTPAPASSTQTDSTLAPAGGGYYVQVAAVSKQEDANALVDALKRKQYPAFSASGADSLFHVQVGPFADVKNAEDMRARLVNDGYNPILKK